MHSTGAGEHHLMQKGRRQLLARGHGGGPSLVLHRLRWPPGSTARPGTADFDLRSVTPAKPNGVATVI
jgi:hypothetical protein